jgi:ubiquinone/menaquinone biosynthesis C-methylase UbiE
VLEKVGVGPKCVVLDFGCGSGTYTIPAARLAGAKGKVYALDRSIQVLEKLEQAANEEGLPNIRTILSSDLRTGLRDESVDIALLHDVLHLVDDRKTLFVQVRRALKPEGRVSIYPMHVDKDKICRQMSNSGFSLIVEEYEGNILVFQKVECKPVGEALEEGKI